MTADEFNDLVMRWSRAKEQLKLVKNEEMELRRQIFFHVWHNPTEGVNILDLGPGWQLKGTHRVNYNLDKTKTADALYTIANTGNQGPFIAEKLVRFKPELSITAYRELEQPYKTIIDQVLTTSNGTPDLELVGPKK